MTGYYSETVNDAIKSARDAGLIVVVAAGNFNRNACAFSPSSAETAIIVGGSDENDRVYKLSNYGACIDLFAPASKINTTGPCADPCDTDCYELVTGTSMAAAHVSGVAAIIWSKRPLSKADDIQRQLMEIVTGGRLDYVSYGSPNKLIYNDNPRYAISEVQESSQFSHSSSLLTMRESSAYITDPLTQTPVSSDILTIGDTVVPIATQLP
jgi:subtilisin family serine protease